MMAQLEQSYCSSSMSLDSMVLMLAASMSSRASNLARRFTLKTSMQLAFDARCPRRAESENQSGVQPRIAQEALRILPDAIHSHPTVFSAKKENKRLEWRFASAT